MLNNNDKLIEKSVKETIAKIKLQGDKPNITVAYQLELLDQLSQSDFGKSLLQHKTLTGYWTHYAVTHPEVGRKTGKNHRGKPFTTLETFFFDRSPVALATQQRFKIFLQENQQQVKTGAKLASIPCGLMSELLYLDFTDTKDIQLIGIDNDAQTLNDAQELAAKQATPLHTQFSKQDAYTLKTEAAYDLISSNGLNIYEANDNKVTQLYRNFYSALKPGGKLVTSFLTPPPTLTQNCEWDMAKVNEGDLLLQKIIFTDILGVKWQCFRSSEQTKVQLETAGFKNIQFIYDKARIFPTAVASKA